jgi:hypothetical protein
MSYTMEISRAMRVKKSIGKETEVRGNKKKMQVNNGD